jgi:tetratricopeptide (TPR) repeat protein
VTRSRALRWIALAALAALGLVALAVGGQQWRLHQRVQEGRRLVEGEAYLPAARALLRAVAMAPDDGQAHYYLGLAYAGMGRPGAALNEVEEAVQLRPAESRYRVGLAGLLLDQGRPTEARAELERVTRSSPGAADVRLLLAEALRQSGDRPAMEREYREVIRQAGHSALGELARYELQAATATDRQ